MFKKYIITLIAGAILSTLSYAAQNRGRPLSKADTSVVEVPLLAVVAPPKPDDANIVSEGPYLGAGAYKDCPGEKRDCQEQWTCRGPLRRIVFAPLRWLFGRRC